MQTTPAFATSGACRSAAKRASVRGRDVDSTDLQADWGSLLIQVEIEAHSRGQVEVRVEVLSHIRRLKLAIQRGAPSKDLRGGLLR